MGAKTSGVFTAKEMDLLTMLVDVRPTDIQVFMMSEQSYDDMDETLESIEEEVSDPDGEVDETGLLSNNPQRTATPDIFEMEDLAPPSVVVTGVSLESSPAESSDKGTSEPRVAVTEVEESSGSSHGKRPAKSILKNSGAQPDGTSSTSLDQRPEVQFAADVKVPEDASPWQTTKRRQPPVESMITAALEGEPSNASASSSRPAEPNQEGPTQEGLPDSPTIPNATAEPASRQVKSLIPAVLEPQPANQFVLPFRPAQQTQEEPMQEGLLDSPTIPNAAAQPARQQVQSLIPPDMSVEANSDAETRARPRGPRSVPPASCPSHTVQHEEEQRQRIMRVRWLSQPPSMGDTEPGRFRRWIKKQAKKVPRPSWCCSCDFGLARKLSRRRRSQQSDTQEDVTEVTEAGGRK